MTHRSRVAARKAEHGNLAQYCASGKLDPCVLPEAEVPEPMSAMAVFRAP
jgi:hypothetical protein